MNTKNLIYKCNEHHKKYKQDYMVSDIAKWQAKHSFNFNFNYHDLQDIGNEIRCEMLGKVGAIDNGSIHNLENYMYRVFKNSLKNILKKESSRRIKHSRYEKDKKLENRQMDDQMIIVDDIIMNMDVMSYKSVKKLLKSCLSLKENYIVHGIHSKYSLTDIADVLGFTEDYVRKLYKQAEKKIIDKLS